jgi:RNA polymerase sigma-70 factor (ECF subfamily)
VRKDIQHVVQEEGLMRGISMTQSEETAFRSPTDEGSTHGNEKRLLTEAKGGSHAAFEKLVESYRTRIFRMAERIAHSHEDAEEVIQRSFQKAFIHLRNFKGNSSFSTWLTRIALNEALMLRRSNQRFRHISIEDLSARDDVARTMEIADSRPNPEHCYFQRERQRLLLSAINELKPGIRTVLQIRDLGEQSVRDTARILGLSASAVKSRVCRGRRELREKLKNSYGNATGRVSGRSRRNRKFQFVS